MKNRLLTASVLAITCCQVLASEWRLSGEARLGDGDWVPIESQSEDVDTRVGREPQLLFPGSLGPQPMPALAMVGGVAHGDGWTYYIAVKDLQLLTGVGKFEFAVRDYTLGEDYVWVTYLQPYDMEADFTNLCYFVEQERDSPVPSSNDSIHVRFKIDRCVPQPEFILAEDAYKYTLWESFDVGFLPVPFVGKIYLQTKDGTNDWTTAMVEPTWFERNDVSVVFGPTSWLWSNAPKRGQSSLRLFRLNQIPFEPTLHTDITREVEVAGADADMDYLTFGEDCAEVILHARWTIPAGSGFIELGFHNSKGSFSTTRTMGSSPFTVTNVDRFLDGTNWVIYAKRLQ